MSDFVFRNGSLDAYNETLDNIQVSSVSQFTKDNFKNVRLIQDLSDLVDAEHTNRPHTDIIENTQQLAGFKDIDAGLSLGEFTSTYNYKKGDIISYNSYFYQATIDAPTETPALPTQSSNSTQWQFLGCVLNSINSNIQPRLKPTEFKSSIPVTSSNGKSFNSYSLSKYTQYTFLRLPELSQFDETFQITLIPKTDYKDMNFIDYVTFDMRVISKGTRENSSSLCVPEIHIGAIHYNSNCADAIQNYNEFSNNLGDDELFDIYGAYGISIQATLRADNYYGVYLSTKYNCTLLVTSSCRNSWILSSELTTGASQFKYCINHLVRPHGADLAMHELGNLIIQETPLTIKQMWDKGLITRNKSLVFNSNEYSLLASHKGIINNYLTPAHTRTGVTQQNSTSQNIQFTLPALTSPIANTQLYMKAF